MRSALLLTLCLAASSSAHATAWVVGAEYDLIDCQEQRTCPLQLHYVLTDETAAQKASNPNYILGEKDYQTLNNAVVRPADEAACAPFQVDSEYVGGGRLLVRWTSPWSCRPYKGEILIDVDEDHVRIAQGDTTRSTSCPYPRKSRVNERGYAPYDEREKLALDKRIRLAIDREDEIPRVLFEEGCGLVKR